VFVRDRQSGSTARVVVGIAGAQPDGNSSTPAISGDGRYVAFQSLATNLVAGDSNGLGDAFVYDRQSGLTERVSVSSGGAQASQGTYNSLGLGFSSDGRFVAFTSVSPDLVAGDTNNSYDIFLRDRLNATTERISLTSAGAQSNAHSYRPEVSDDGRYVVFDSDASLIPSDVNLSRDVYLRDRQAAVTTCISVTPAGGLPAYPGYSESPSISHDGRFVAFTSHAVELVAGDPNAIVPDVFVRDLQASTTHVVDVPTGGAPANGPSGDAWTYTRVAVASGGRAVSFESVATNLVVDDTNGVRDVFVRDYDLCWIERVSIATGGAQANGASGEDSTSISADGRFVAFESLATNLVAGDTNASRDVFVRDRQNATTARVSVGFGGVQANNHSWNPALSADGRYVAFDSWASNLIGADSAGNIDVFVRDLQLGTTECVSVYYAFPAPANLNSQYASISADGRYVAFESLASNIVPGDTNARRDVFVRDRQLGVNERISVSSAGAQANWDSGRPSISADGRYVVFESGANIFVPGDPPFTPDVFLRDRQTSTTTMESLATGGVHTPGTNFSPSISDSGRFIAFASTANFDAADTNGLADVYVRDRECATTGLASVSSSGALGDNQSFAPCISPDGRFVGFVTEATNLALDGNAYRDVYLRDRGVIYPYTYCTAGTTSNGCVPSISSSGCPRASATSGFTIAISGVEGQKQGHVFYGINGAIANPWGPASSSYLCVKAPTQRTPTQNSGGTNGACDGAVQIDWLDYVATHPGSLGVPFSAGTQVWAQLYFRDPPAPKTTNLSDGLTFVISP
jgi:Tol biopolymer transport system component